MITDAKLDFWIKNNLNVLFIGEHGVGKTARVKEAFDKAGLKWLYFSASTLDPWVDFIGIPKETVDEKGNKYIDLIRPKDFANDEVEAIFLDEFNRSPSKIRNAVMELIQFKSINGKKFNNLKIIWAAINPENVKDEENRYDVQTLDPAQKDRFQVHVKIPYKPDREYFCEKYGSKGVNAVEWWLSLKENEKEHISPRRLDYMLDIYNKKGDVRDLVPHCINISKFLNIIGNGSPHQHMLKVVKRGDEKEIKKFINDRNNYDAIINIIVKNNKLIDTFIPHIKQENLVQLMDKNKKVYEYIKNNATNFQETIKSIITANNMPSLVKKLQKIKTVDISFLIPDVKTYTYTNCPLPNFNSIKSLIPKDKIIHFARYPQQSLRVKAYMSVTCDLDFTRFTVEDRILVLEEILYYSTIKSLIKSDTKFTNFVSWFGYFAGLLKNVGRDEKIFSTAKDIFRAKQINEFLKEVGHKYV